MPNVKDIRYISKKIAEELDMYPHIVEEIIKSQFKYIRNHIESGDTSSIRLIKLGLITPFYRFRKYGTIKEYFKEHGVNKKDYY